MEQVPVRVSGRDLIRFNKVSGSGFRIRIQEGKNDPEKYKNVKIFRTAGCSLLRAEGFPRSRDVLMEAYIFDQKKMLRNFSCNFFQILIIKILDLDWLRIRIGI
jgi:hypothetical protein